LASRLAVLTAFLALPLAGCLRPAAPAAARGAGCTACHAPHFESGGSCAECHRGRPDAARKELAHERLLTGRVAEHRSPASPAVGEGERLVEALACRRCHTIGGEGNRLATDLDGVAWQREQAALVASITEPVASMPRFGLGTRQAEAIVAVLLRRGDPGRREDAYRVHFDRAPAALDTPVFERACGGCHRVLTPSGPLGTGDAGPDLSGLFTRFYPKTAPGGVAWAEPLLLEWTRNPRASRPATTMPPAVPLSEGDWRRLVAELGSGHGR
jgi:mono/diheme cytochrome c family protein